MNFIEYLEDNFHSRKVADGRELLLDDECPFCGRSGKIYVSVKKQAGECKRCGEGFKAVKFVMAHQACSFKEAKQILRDSSYESPEIHEEEVPELWFPPMIDLDADGADYLAGRGMLETGRAFGAQQCVQDVQLDGKIYSTAGRVIIPIRNAAGEVVSWQGRDITGRSRMKYMFGPGFKKADHLYNVNSINAELPVIVCEGAMDVWGWARAGFKNAVATFGKTISEEQIRQLIEAGVKKIFIAWDSDAAWQKSEFVERFGHHFEILIVDLKGKDADEVAEGVLESALDAAVEYDWQQKILAQL